MSKKKIEEQIKIIKHGTSEIIHEKELIDRLKTKKKLTNPQENYTKSLVSSVPPTNKKISRFKIIEKENKTQGETNIKILNRWTKKEIINQDLVQVKNLNKTFDDSFFTETSKNSVMAVNDVSFNIKEGESFGLVGESGSGKSTIAKIIVNLYRPSSGDIFFDNVLFENNKIKAIIDFEEACNYYLIFDLGMGILGLCRTGEKIDLNKARALIKGYEQIRSLGVPERDSLQLFIEYAAIATSWWRFWKYNIHTPTPDLRNKHWKMVQVAKEVEILDKKHFLSIVFE